MIFDLFSIHWCMVHNSMLTYLEGPMTLWVHPHSLMTQISSVGYGDVTPQSNAARAIVICIILVAIVVLPTRINAIFEVLSHRYYRR